MSSTISFADVTVWGSNGQVELYVQALLEQARQRFGEDDEFTVFFLTLCDQFPLMGGGVFLDDLLTNQISRLRFVDIARAASRQLESRFGGYPHGIHWLEVEIAGLLERVTPASE